MKKLLILMISLIALSSCASVSLVDKQPHCKPVKHKNHKMVKCAYSILFMMVLSILSSCNVLDKLSGTPYWEEVCFESYARYDSSTTYRKQLLVTPKTYVYVTDSTNHVQYIVIWGDECKFQPGEQLSVKWEHAHSPSGFSNGWRASLVDNHFHYSYGIFK